MHEQYLVESPEPRLHLDADASKKTLHKALLERGHDVIRIPTEWMLLDATDEMQPDAGDGTHPRGRRNA
ncbi:MAG TPA: hypothetical protein PLX26_05815, partial [Candidatus Competibacteraceae bacterium]|nr:hypothetical protein [Candidatus Competibacteraceae bacterium]